MSVTPGCPEGVAGATAVHDPITPKVNKSSVACPLLVLLCHCQQGAQTLTDFC